MIIDRQARVSNAQAITSTAVSTDTYDLTTARDIGAGNDIEIFCRVVTTFTTGTSATLSVEYITSANADLSSQTTVVATPALAVASLTAGTELLRIRVPVTPLGGARYIGLRYVVGVGTFTAGAVTAGFILDRQADAYYASGVPVGGF